MKTCAFALATALLLAPALPAAARHKHHHVKHANAHKGSHRVHPVQKHPAAAH